MSGSGATAPGGIGCLVLAAREGRRFGSAKQPTTLGGRPLLEHVLPHAAATAVNRVVAVLGAGADRGAAEVDPHGAELLVCDDRRKGMATSVREGITALSDCAAAVILLGDQPLVGPAAVERLLAARGAGWDAIRATYDGERGHPVLIERRLFAAVATLEGDVGARSLLAAARTRAVSCDDVADPLDVDPPADSRLAEQAHSLAPHAERPSSWAGLAFVISSSWS